MTRKQAPGPGGPPFIADAAKPEARPKAGPAGKTGPGWTAPAVNPNPERGFSIAGFGHPVISAQEEVETTGYEESWADMRNFREFMRGLFPRHRPDIRPIVFRICDQTNQSLSSIPYSQLAETIPNCHDITGNSQPVIQPEHPLATTNPV
jgi:hypothetical protein